MTGAGSEIQGSTTDQPGLTPAHRHQLEIVRGIPADLLAEEGICSLPGAYAVPQASPELRHPDPRKGRRFGKYPDVISAGILFPFWDPRADDGRMLSYQYRSDHPREIPGQDGKRRTVKYESPPGARLALYIPRRVRSVLGDPTVWLRITEGPAKALAAVGRGFPTIALAGVDGWVVKVDPDQPSVPLPDWMLIALDGRLVLIEFDSDVMTKPSVKGALDRQTRFLESRGAIVVPVILPPTADGGKQGLDDFLAAGGDLTALENAAIVAALRRGRDRPAAGADGQQTCQNCAPVLALANERKRQDELRRSGPFGQNVASVILVLLTTAHATRTNGQPQATLLRDDVARLANVDPRDVTRAYAAWEALQGDPDLAGRLPFRLDRRRDKQGHDHVDLVPRTDGEPWTVADACLALTQLPRSRPRPGGARRGEPAKRPPSVCDCGGQKRPVQTVCDQCGQVEHRRPPRVDGDATGDEKPVDILSTRPGPVFSAPSVSMVDILSTRPPRGAAGADDDPPRPTVPDWQPPPLAPSHHIARGFQRRSPDPDAGQAP